MTAITVAVPHACRKSGKSEVDEDGTEIRKEACEAYEDLEQDHEKQRAAPLPRREHVGAQQE
jgi:hypothetical protein